MVRIDISFRHFGFWSFWLFVIPSLRARRPRGWEKLALDIAFLGSPIITIGAPFVAKEPPSSGGANLRLLIGCLRLWLRLWAGGASAQSPGAFTGALNAIDFGSGQERGIRGAARERYLRSSQPISVDYRNGGGGAGVGVAGDVPSE